MTLTFPDGKIVGDLFGTVVAFIYSEYLFPSLSGTTVTDLFAKTVTDLIGTNITELLEIIVKFYAEQSLQIYSLTITVLLRLRARLHGKKASTLFNCL